MDPFQAETEANIARWFGIEPPNDAARRMAADLASTIAAFMALRDTLVFEDEPSSFEAALQATKDTGDAATGTKGAGA
ncbi:MAG: hypothetical protein BGO51_00595 [Rhodospirillales bacterium 69-11]|nr:hypothetical protein [Rhodospirillales bacterium]MBN8928385.1 hypothetical protein [Rhodospirillales bacterium]OJW23788.1 MAG: hypothetical protein BGO51_00595 [Rhodospirillales bacterium 69-11]